MGEAREDEGAVEARREVEGQREERERRRRKGEEVFFSSCRHGKTARFEEDFHATKVPANTEVDDGAGRGAQEAVHSQKTDQDAVLLQPHGVEAHLIGNQDHVSTKGCAEGHHSESLCLRDYEDHEYGRWIR